jgi:hypothetical protein
MKQSNNLLVTTTSGRPKAFGVLQKWVKAQTTDDFHWLVVSDDWEGYQFNKSQTVIKRDASEDTLPSLNHNWLKALEYIESKPEYQKIVVIEDDDYYASDYVKNMIGFLDEADLAGYEEDAYYYVVNRRARSLHNVGFASLAATGFTRAVLSWFKTCASENNIFIDKTLWQGLHETVLIPQPSLMSKDGRMIQPPPVPYKQSVARWEGKRMLADNFTGLKPGEKLELKDGWPRDYRPRHVGMKENWHGGKDGLSKTGHDALQGSAQDPFGNRLKAWVPNEVATYYLNLTAKLHPSADPNTQRAKGGYPNGVIVPLPVATSL